MEERKKVINKDSIIVEEGKLIISDEEVANLIASEDADLLMDEEAGINVCIRCTVQG